MSRNRWLWRSLAALAGALALPGCAPVDVLNAITPKAGVTITRDLAYGTDPRQTLDIYQPAHPQPGRPGVVFFYGGSWNSGSKSIYPFVAATLARQGILVFVPDYRLYPQITFPAFLQDSARAAIWARDHASQYGGSPTDLFLMGHSAGAYNAAMLALDPEWFIAAGGSPPASPSDFRGMIGLAGPYDFLPMTGPEVIAAFAGRKNDPLTQPSHYVHAGAPPLLLLAGTDDKLVEPANVTRLATFQRAKGGDVETHIYPGVGHIGLLASIAPLFQSRDPALADILAFIAAHRAP